MRIAPFVFNRSTKIESSRGTVSRRGEPQVVRIPFVEAKSLTAWGNPCIQPKYSPRVSCASRSVACASSASRGCSETMALTLEFVRSMWSRNVDITSLQETRFCLIDCERVRASIVKRSEMDGLTAWFSLAALNSPSAKLEAMATDTLVALLMNSLRSRQKCLGRTAESKLMATRFVFVGRIIFGSRQEIRAGYQTF